MRTYCRGTRRQSLLGSALLAWLTLSAAPTSLGPASAGIDGSPPDVIVGTPACDSHCLNRLRARLLELHRHQAPVWRL